ncbi:metallophosphoesterase [Pseudomaricurvus alkylphenolicus]|uniref:metallophosphoesterase n=1 Tax=Pseudomaricurvus alkylphenolicus TaxID=1306991 RepID=UPI00141F04A6|nr:metallophosphoesterase [Pseudomaricurvus alkylphenolicus]
MSLWCSCRYNGGQSRMGLLRSSVLVTAFLLSSGVGAEESASMIRGPYLQMATPDSITVVWRSDKPIEPVVRYGLQLGKQEQTEEDNVFRRIAPVVDKTPAEHFARLHSAEPNTYQYEMTLTGLQPETKYFYSVWDGDKPLADADKNRFFETHPAVGESRNTRLWVVGDSGTGTPEQHKVYQTALDYVAKTKAPIDLYLHVGDMAYTSGEDKEFQKNFFDIYQPTLQNTVVWPSMGNHEGFVSSGKTADGPYYDAYVTPTGGEAGGVPSGTEAYYSFDYGNIHFICLDSHDLDRFPDGLMARWLERDLQATEAEWLIAFWHHPPYTKGSHDSDTQDWGIEMREHIMPILEKHGVDVVFTGHSHVYERSMLIDKAYHTPTTSEGVVLDDGDGHMHGDGAYHKSHGLNPHEGTAQIVTGHGGAPLARIGAMPVMRQSILEHGSMIIDIEGDTLTAKNIGVSGRVIDEFHLVKKGRVKPTIVKNPWSPVGPKITPAGGSFPAGAVSLSHSGYWESGEIRFTLDGSEPTLDSPLYEGPIELPKGSNIVSLKAASFKGKDEQPSMATIANYKAFGPDIPRARNPITVDGKLDDWSQWQGEAIVLGAEFQIIDSKMNAAWNGSKDLGAELKLAWAPEGLYFAVSVVDDVYLPAANNYVLGFDNMTFMIDGRLPENRNTTSLGDGAYMVIISEDANAIGEKTRALSLMKDVFNDKVYQYKAQRTKGGYLVEFFVPFSEALFKGQDFGVGRELQLSLTLIDHDSPGEFKAKAVNWGALPDRSALKRSTYWKPMRLGE